MASKRKHVRIICPHCTKRVRLAPPRTPFGWLRPVPCPNCHIPIRPAQIKAQLEPAPSETGEEGGEATAASSGNISSEEGESTPEIDREAGSSR